MIAVEKNKTSKIIKFEDLAKIRALHAGEKIVHCHGVFDVLHAGHLAYLESARKFGQILVVTLTADSFVNKGPGRPHFTDRIRSRMLAALEVVDYVAVNHNLTAVPVIDVLRPDFYVKGPDYKDRSKDVTGEIYREQSAVEKHGGRIEFTDDETWSSSALINKFFSDWSEGQLKVIREVQEAGGMQKISSLIEQMADEHVRIIGEPIVDTYIFCNPESISSKNPCISAQFLYEENYAGGSLAIANHLADFCNDVSVVFTHGGEDYFLQLLNDKVDARVQVQGVEALNIPTPRKTRYLAIGSSQRMFEITDIRHDQWRQMPAHGFCDLLNQRDYSQGITIVADFGHGLIEESVIHTIGGLKGFVALNAQTNSSNFGFNPFTKHKSFKYLCIDFREARLAYHDRYTPAVDLVKKIHSDLKYQSSVSVTLGPNGSHYFPPGEGAAFVSPAFADQVVDATGAGDAYFAMTSMLIKMKAPPCMVPFMGNVFAGLKTKIVGNKASVSRAQFIKALDTILK